MSDEEKKSTETPAVEQEAAAEPEMNRAQRRALAKGKPLPQTPKELGGLMSGSGAAHRAAANVQRNRLPRTGHK